MRSHNNNVFLHNPPYKGNRWSRILFYDPGTETMEAQRRHYGVPDSLIYITVDLTPSDWANAKIWSRISEFMLYFHTVPLDKRYDIITGSVPENVVDEMFKHLDEDSVMALLHVDFMALIDMGAYEGLDGAAFPLSSVLKETV